MRDVNLSLFVPHPHAAYFGHVSSSPAGDAVGLVVVHIENGRYPCLGIDNVPDDGYAGDVHCDSSGFALADVPVQYFQAGGEGARARTLITETKTDAEGRHSLWLEPGVYEYRFLGATGVAGETHTVSVHAGRLVTWETPGEDGQSTHLSREIGQVYEDLVCDWNLRDGMAFSWPDIEHTISEVCKMASFRYVTFDKTFCKPDVIPSLQRQGVSAFSSEIAEGQLSAAYRNLVALGNAECLSLMNHDAANYQLQRGAQWANDKRVQAPAGSEKYLADARACAVYFAAQAASMEQPQSMDLGSPFARLGGSQFRNADAAMDDVLGAMVPRPRGPVPEIRYVPLGTAKKETNHGW